MMRIGAGAIAMGIFGLLLPGTEAHALPPTQINSDFLRFQPWPSVGKPIRLARSVRAVSSGEDHTLALFDDGSVAAWGLNQSGQCDVPADLQDVVKIAAGAQFSVALHKDGRIITWGRVDQKAFADVRARSFACAQRSLGVIRMDGSVSVWNVYEDGTASVLKDEIGKWASGFKNAWQIVVREAYEGQLEPAAILRHWPGLDHLVFRRLPGIVILDEERTAHFLADDGTPTVLASQIAEIAGSSDRLLAIKDDGILQAWGSSKTIHRHPAKLGKLKLVAGGDGITLAVTEKDELLMSTGDGSDNKKIRIPPGEIVGIESAPAYFSFLIYKDGKIVPIGGDYAGQASLPSKPCKILKTVTAAQYTIVLRSDGSATGWDEYWQKGFGVTASDDSGLSFAQSSIPLGLGKIRDFATGPNFTALLMEDDTLIGWGDQRHGVFDLPESAKALRTIVCGDRFLLGLDGAGEVHAWGDNRRGQCEVPATMGKVTQIAAGGTRAHALDENGTVFSWGDTYTKKTRPHTVPRPQSLKHITAISAGYTHSLALRRDGTVVAWGDNRDGQCNVPADLKPCKAISAGSFISVAIERDTGKTIVWGDPGCEPPNDLPPLKSVSAGHRLIMGVTEGGSLTGWGKQRVRPAAYSIPVGLLGLAPKK